METSKNTLSEWVFLFHGAIQVFSVYTQEFLNETQELQGLLAEKDEALTVEQSQEIEKQLHSIMASLSAIDQTLSQSQI